MPTVQGPAAAERAFQLHYAGLTSALGLGFTALGLISYLGRLIKAVLLRNCGTPAQPNAPLFIQLQQLWLRVFVVMIILMLSLLLGWDRFVLDRGQNSVWVRVLVAAGVLFSPAQPQSGFGAWLCRHRLLLVHMAAVVMRIPVGWYWLGGGLCWVVAASAETADPSMFCSNSLLCLLRRLQVQTANPAQFLQNVISRMLSNSWIVVIDVVLPGLLLTWLELRARKAWLQLQQQPRMQPQHDSAPLATQALQHKACPGTADHSPDAHTTAAAGSAGQRDHEAAHATPEPVAAAATARQESTVHTDTYPPRSAPPVLELAHVQRHSSSTQRRSLVYNSPLNWHLVSVKLSQAPSTGAADALSQQIAAAISSAAAASSVNNAEQQQPRSAVIVTDIAAFPGCYQLLLQLALPAQQQLQPQQEGFEQHLSAMVQQVTAEWPNVELLDIKVAPLHLQQHGHHLSTAGQSEPEAGAAVASQGDAATAAVQATAGVIQSSSSVTSLVDGIYMRPAAAGMPCGPAESIGVYCSTASPITGGSTTAAGSGTAGISAGPETTAALQVQLCIPQPIVRQLLAAGQSAVRVVVAPQQPAGELLLDRSYQLQDLQATSQSMLAKNDGIVSLMPQDTAGAVHATTADMNFNWTSAQTATMQRGNNVSMITDSALIIPLQLQLPASLQFATSRPDVQMLTVVVLGQCSKGRGTLAAMEQGATPTTASFAVASHLHGVLAKLPLLVLPTGAAKELQEFSQQLVCNECSDDGAYQQLLPFLRDVCAVVCMAASRGSLEVVQREQVLHLLNALCSFCEQHGLQECSHLLHVVCQNDAEGGSAQQTDATRRMHSTGASDQAAVQGRAEPAPGTDCTSSGNTQLLGAETKLASKLGTAVAASSSSASTVRPNVAELLGFDAAADNLHASGVALKTAVVGFASPAVEAAYRTYKAAVLQRQDLCIMLISILALITLQFKLALLPFRAHSDEELYVLHIRIAFVAMHVLPRVVIWAAGCLPQRFGAVQQRGVVSYTGPIMVMCIVSACLSVGGNLAAAMWTIIRGLQSWRWALVLHRHVVLPATMCAEAVPGALLYVVLNFVLFEPFINTFYGVPRYNVLGLGQNGTSVMLASLHLAVVVWQELRLRRMFVHDVTPYRSG